MEHVREFRCMGCQIRVVVGRPLRRDLAPSEDAARDAEEWLHDFDARLSRFRADSELTELNDDPRPEVPVSRLLCTAVQAGLSAAEATEGLLDPTLIDALETLGYGASRAGVEPASIDQALAAAPPREPASPRPDARWRRFRVDPQRCIVTRPPGLRFDTGGSGKGLAADGLAYRLSGYERFAIDCAGDLRIGGPGAEAEPYQITIEHPLTRAAAHVLEVGAGGIATSGIGARLWRNADGSFHHHLIDPASGRPAWTGLIAATALAPTAIEAETFSKVAILSGPEGARETLAQHGGLIIHDDGTVEAIGRIARPQIRIQL